MFMHSSTSFNIGLSTSLVSISCKKVSTPNGDCSPDPGHSTLLSNHSHLLLPSHDQLTTTVAPFPPSQSLLSFPQKVLGGQGTPIRKENTGGLGWLWL